MHRKQIEIVIFHKIQILITSGIALKLWFTVVYHVFVNKNNFFTEYLWIVVGQVARKH